MSLWGYADDVGSHRVILILMNTTAGRFRFDVLGHVVKNVRAQTGRQGARIDGARRPERSQNVRISRPHHPLRAGR